MSVNYTIEEAKIADLDQIREIYAYYVERTTATLEEKIPSKDEMLNTYELVLSKNLPFLVARQNSKVLGFCYAQPFRKRSAYRYTVEHSIYVHKDFLRRGIAKDLTDELIKRCKEIGYKQIIAVVVSSENDSSVKFHKSMGFMDRGKLTGVGYKFNKWLDTILLQKSL
jgi:phosphinothricin acetyltransferase